MQTKYLIALGGNLPSRLGDARATLAAAIDALATRGARTTARSAWYRTPAAPAGSGPDFVNGAAAIESAEAPAGLLATLHAVERDLGRDRQRRWAPRVCDLDLLAAGATIEPDRAEVEKWMALPAEAQMTETPPWLILPHPRLHQRAFVLRPLLDVAPDWRHPVLALAPGAMLAALGPEALAGIEPLED
jgi:2-amino-4-hydroxy-6-hydroxymethyldihydropteridine diphosphokinase